MCACVARTGIGEWLLARLLGVVAVVVLALIAGWLLWLGNSRTDIGGSASRTGVEQTEPIFVVEKTGFAKNLTVSLNDQESLATSGGRALPLTIIGRRVPLAGQVFMHQ